MLQYNMCDCVCLANRRPISDLIRHVVHHYDAVGSSVVTGRDGAEPFLTGRVPLRRQSSSVRRDTHQTLSPPLSLNSPLTPRCAHNLKLYGLPVQLDGPDLEVHANGANVALCVRIILAENKYTLSDTIRAGLSTVTALTGRMRTLKGCYVRTETHCEPEKETRLSDTRITDQEQFE